MTTAAINRPGKSGRMQVPATRRPEVQGCEAGGRELRVMRWKANSQTDNRPLLFFSGIGSNAEILSPFMERLTGRDVITFDMPGIGGSTTAGGPYRLSTMAETAVEVLDGFGYVGADLMGASWGGMLVQQMAHQFPDRTGRIILAGTSMGMTMVPGRLAALTMMLNLRRFKDADFLRRHFGTLYGGGNRGWERYADGVQPPTALGYLYQLGALAGWTSLIFLPRLSARTLVLGATDDSLVRPVNLHALHALLPDSELHLIEGAGHMFLLSHLDEAAAKVEAFLDHHDGHAGDATK